MIKRLMALLAVSGLLLAACGGGDDESSGTGDSVETPATSEAPAATDGTATSESPATEAPAASDADPDGVVKFGYDLGAASRGGFKWDPSTVTSPTTDMGIYNWVYGTLLRPNGEGVLEPDLAESVTVVDPNTIEVVVREGLTLSDGTPVDGAMVKTILEGNLAKAQNPAYRPGFYSLQSIELTEPNTLTLTIPDGTAASWGDLYLSGVETVIVPPGTNFDAPVGAGPFTVAANTPGQTMTLEKNPAYWDADAIQVAGIELTAIPPDNPQAATGALNAGQLDRARLNFASIDAVSGDVEVVAEADPEFETQLLICKTTEPFDDVRVRQALNLATDREVINEALFNGTGVVAWDLWPEGHPLHNEELSDQYAYDPEAAKTLLAEAGAEALTVDVIPVAGANVPEVVQIMQQQWAEVGVTMNIVQSTAFQQDFLANNLAPLGGVPRSGGGRAKIDNFNGETSGNVCGYNDPELASLVTELATVSDSSEEGVQVWNDIQRIIVDDALSVPVVFQPLVYAINPTHLGGYDLVTAYTISVPDMKQLYVKA